MKHHGPRDAGTLVLVVGASGVGKDTLIEAARHRFGDDARFLFPKRIITRGDHTGEPHLAIGKTEFGRLEARGSLFLCWHAHGFGYGIPTVAKRALQRGRTVVVNVSRTTIAEARKRWPRTRVVHVTVAPEILKQRLLARGRETEEDIAKRLERAGAISVPHEPWVDTVDNSGDPAAAATHFTELIAGYAEATNAAQNQAGER